jgi:competence protein ComEC
MHGLGWLLDSGMVQPMFYGAVAAALGIVVAALPSPVPAPAALIWATAAAGIAAGCFAVSLARQRRMAAAALGLAFCLLLGYARAAYVARQPPAVSALARVVSTLEPGVRDRLTILAYLRDQPQPLFDHGHVSALRLDVSAIAAGTGLNSALTPVSAGVRLYAYAPVAPALLQLSAGEGIAFDAHLRPLPTYHDPGVADFAAAARREDVEFSGTLDPGRWRAWPAIAGPRLAATRAHLWAWISQHIDQLAPPATASRANALLRGMLLGDVARLDETTRTSFQEDGTYHLLVVAGLHVGLLVILIGYLLRGLRMPLAWSHLVSLGLLGIYAWVIVGRTPTLRVLLMLAVYYAAELWFRDRQALNSVGIAALVLLALHPLDLFSAGFQMSLGAAILLAGVSRPLTPHSAPRYQRFAAHVVIASLVLQIGFAGFNTVYFHRVSPWSMLANVVLVPMASALIPIAWIAVALGPVAAHVTGPLLVGFANLMIRAADAMARWPGANGRVPAPPGWFLVLFGLAVTLWIVACARNGARRPWQWASTGGMAAFVVALSVVHFPPRLPPGLTATVLDVGQGDSIFVSFPDGRTLLVDGGPRSAHWDTGAEIVAPFLWSLGLRHLDAVLLSHGHNDHLGGLSTVLADFHPGEIWFTRSLPGEPAMAAFLRQARASGATLRRVSSGDAFLAGASRLDVLLPAPDYLAGDLASNNDSLALRLSWGNESMLLTGDTEVPGERWMLDHHLALASPLLKVGHHGSNTSSTPDFLAAVRPAAAIISVGAGNMYGHPSPEVVERLQASGVRVFRTDRDGAVQCRLSQHDLSIFLFRRRPGIE